MMKTNSSTQPDNTSRSVEDLSMMKAMFRQEALSDYRIARRFFRSARALKRQGDYDWADLYRDNAKLHLDSARAWRRVLNTLKPKRS